MKHFQTIYTDNELLPQIFHMCDHKFSMHDRFGTNHIDMVRSYNPIHTTSIDIRIPAHSIKGTILQYYVNGETYYRLKFKDDDNYFPPPTLNLFFMQLDTALNKH